LTPAPEADTRFALLLKVTTTYSTWGGTTNTHRCGPPARMVPAPGHPRFAYMATLLCDFCGATVAVGELTTEAKEDAYRARQPASRRGAIAGLVLAIACGTIVIASAGSHLRGLWLTLATFTGLAALWCFTIAYQDGTRGPRRQYDMAIAAPAAEGKDLCAHSFDIAHSEDGKTH
jgi:hypothetical protein